MSDSKLTRIGVFYDGNYFFHVSNYYAYSISGAEAEARRGCAGPTSEMKIAASPQ